MKSRAPLHVSLVVAGLASLSSLACSGDESPGGSEAVRTIDYELFPSTHELSAADVALLSELEPGGGLRFEVPWTDRSPEEVVRDQLRFSLTPVDGPDTDQLRRVIDHLGSDQLILFSTDYPHNQFDGDDPFPSTFDPALRSIIASDAPLGTYARLGASA